LSLSTWPAALLILVVAFLYSSVGFGGASSYLAVMSLFSYPPAVASTIALTLNVLVAGVAFLNYYRNHHLQWRLLLPFLVTSVPASFLGGTLQVSTPVYQVLLNMILVYVAVHLLFLPEMRHCPEQERLRPTWWLILGAGAAIGLLSGIIGVGGGIFLSPLIVLTGWGNAKQASASSAAFIVLNSLGGVAGRAWNGNLNFGGLGLPFIIMGLIGGISGSALGARRLRNQSLQRILGAILLLVVVRNIWGLLH
jgi:uncharacterized membrane protein YfcA